MKSKVAVPGAALGVVVLAIAAVSYSLVQSMVNPGLEAIRAHVHTDQVGVTWVLTAFLLSSAVLTPVVGRLGDQLGKRSTLFAVFVLLTIGSVVAAAAPNLGVLVVGRILQGAGGATLPLAFGLVRDWLPAQRTASTVGLIAAITAAGGAVGVLVTGPIITGLGVPWLFWLPAIANGLVGIAVLLLLPAAGPTAGGRMNWPAGMALTATLVLVLLPLSLGQEWGWLSARTIGLFAFAVLAGVLWVRIEYRSRHALIDMRVFTLRPVWTANLASFLFGVTLYSAFGFIPSFLQVPTSSGYGLGQSVTASGLVFLPMTLTQVVGGLAAAPLTRRLATKSLLILGTVPIIACFLLLAAFHDHIWQVATATAIGGLGFGTGLSALSALVVHAVPAEHTGAATGMNANIRTVGGAVGAAVVAGVLTSSTTAGGFPSEHGFRIAFLLLAGAALVGLATCLLIPRGAARPGVRTQRGRKLRADRDELAASSL